MRYIEIDGERYNVSCCNDCPCYDGGLDAGCGDLCKHPLGDEKVAGYGGFRWYNKEQHEVLFDDDVPVEYRYGPNCPLREVR